MKIGFKEVLFWIFLIIAMILLVWNVFRNSPTEMFTIIGIMFMIVLKMWTMSDVQIKSDMKIRTGFKNINDDINIIKRDVNLIKDRLKI